jgi:hypothetical protein
MKSARHFRELDVYQGAMSLVLSIFEDKAFSNRGEVRADESSQAIISFGMRKFGTRLA